MSTTTWTRRLTVTDPTGSTSPHRQAVSGICHRLTGLVLAIYCPACNRWVKPARFQPGTGTCRRCARNRHHTESRPRP
jgi:hypothetical protein